LEAMKLLFLAFFLALAAGKAVIPCGTWSHYYQCDSRWANDPLGTSTVDTICSAGCALTSTTMALYKYNTVVNNDIAYPPNLNNWLIANGGYVQKDLLVWASISKLGTLCMLKYVQSLSISEIKTDIQNCWPIVINVRSGSHWVLVIGYDDSDSTIVYVNDPAYSNTYYALSGVSNYVVYAKYGTTGCQYGDDFQPNGSILPPEQRIIVNATQGQN